MELADVATDALRLVLALALPALVVSFVVSLLVSFFEMLTHVQDGVLAFAPRLVAVGAALFLGREFMAGELLRFTTQLFARIAQLAR
ncbi:MAG TPA: flagellar biosynthetic protein FliQ [Polyangiales bacterium]|nr:flagellar biosynthetic protein FliQ [Polyangiales bacterium]